MERTQVDRDTYKFTYRIDNSNPLLSKLALYNLSISQIDSTEIRSVYFIFNGLIVFWDYLVKAGSNTIDITEFTDVKPFLSGITSVPCYLVLETKIIDTEPILSYNSRSIHKFLNKLKRQYMSVEYRNFFMVYWNGTAAYLEQRSSLQDYIDIDDILADKGCSRCDLCDDCTY